MTTFHASSGLDIREQEPLKPHTTFKIGGPARYFTSASSQEQAREALGFALEKGLAVFILGGGSNILVSDRGFDGLVLHPTREGLRVAKENAEQVRVQLEAAEPWDRAVAQAVEQGWWGIENLSHIPGQSGAALVQNIGAYGQQLSHVFESAEVLELRSGNSRCLGPGDCGLGYRQSIFNTSRRGELLILNITLRLARRPQPNLRYRDVAAYFEAQRIPEPSQLQIRRAIIAIRDRKFPYPREERGGNAGSFFKNPTLPVAEFERLATRIRQRFGAGESSRLAELRDRSESDGAIKVPAAWLIELCGLKGLEVGRAQVNPSQPLVILNLGGATAGDVLRLAGQVRRTVYRETWVALALEPELVGLSPEEQQACLGLD